MQTDTLNKQEYFSDMFEDTAGKVTSSLAGWTGFLDVVGKLYKYPFHEQLMIYAQRPNATACAEYGLWNNTMNRYVRRGASGIALIDPQDKSGKLRYVFDVSDTGGRDGSRRPFLWEMQSHHEQPIAEMLTDKFGADGNNLADMFYNIAKNMASEYYIDHRSDISYLTEDSFLEELDDYNVQVAFENAASVSIAYTLMKRCGLDTESYFDHEDFSSIFDFNTIQTATLLGTATSEQSEQVFREIAKTISKTERSLQNEQSNLSPRGGLQNPEHQAERTADRADRQIWANEGNLSQGTPLTDVQLPTDERETAVSPTGNRPNSEQTIRANDERIDPTKPTTRQDEVSNGLGSPHEQLESPSGGNNQNGADLQLTPDTGEQLTLFPTAEQQIQNIADRQERVRTQRQSAISISQDEINAELKRGTGTVGGKFRVYALYQQNPTQSQALQALKDEYGWYGHSHTFLDGTRGYINYKPSEGMSISHYSDDTKVVLKWTEVEKHLRALTATDSYLTAEEKAKFEEQQLATVGLEDVSTNAETTPPIDITLDPVPIWWKNYTKVKFDNPDTIVLHQLGDFFEAFNDDAKLMASEFDLTMASREIRGLNVRVGMVGVPAHSLENYTQKLLDSGHKVALMSLEDGRRQVKHLTSSQEEQQTEDVEGVLSDAEVAELSERLANTDPEDSPFVRQVIADVERITAEENAKETAEPITETTITDIGDGDIKNAILNWNGDSDSRTRMIAYMLEHSRDRGTDKWLQNEFGGNLPAFTVRKDELTQEIPWAKVQRHLGQIVAQNRELLSGAVATEPTAPQQEVTAETTPTVEITPIIDETPPFPYKVGDVVQLENGINFIIEGISNREVELRDPTLVYPIFRAESKENFLRLVELYAPVPPTPTKPQAENFYITDMELGHGGKKEKFNRNITAIQTLQLLEREDRNATPEEQQMLSQYVGWGGISEAFDERKDNWHNEYLQLKGLLSEEEYEAARGSVLNAHYTSPTVIKAIYDAVEQMGFTNGNILEPACGTGNFFGMLPDSMAKSNLFGVELDSVTGRIAKKLYPTANITVSGFEQSDLPDSFFDVAIGNVPFGDYGLTEKRYDAYNFRIHDHFFAKSLDKVRPGGIVAFVTSKGTMDKQNSKVRRYLAQRAELLGAIRLPNNAFSKNAGTEVTADIVFLQKRESPLDVERDWIHLGMTEDGIAVNSYFAENPHMILGEMKEINGLHGKEPACVPIMGADLAEQLQQAIRHIEGQITEAELPDMEMTEDTSIPADPNVKNHSYTVVDGEVYFRENSRMVKPDLNATAKERVKGMVEIKECVNDLIRYQLEDYSDEVIKAEQVKLNTLYDNFTAKYGVINSRGNALAFSEDNSYYLLCSLEDINEDGTLKSKADMFSKRTINKAVQITSVDTPSEALAVSIAEKAKVDMPFMAKLTGMTEDEIVEGLQGVIFRVPTPFSEDATKEYVTADEYLSGNVREKLRVAQLAVQSSEEYRPNVEALTLAQPKDLDASEITVKLGSTWVDPKYIQEFMYELFDTPYRNQSDGYSKGIEVKFTPFTSEWRITNKNATGYDDVNATMTYGTGRANAYRILEDTLNLRDVRIYDTVTDPDGTERRVLNKDETTLAQQKQQVIKDAFSEWIFRDADRRQDLVATYNEKFNSVRLREYDGKHITFVGMNPEIKLETHQVNAIARVLYGGNTLLAHEVGAGKSFEMIAAAMESKRLGLCQKSLFNVPNHLVGEMASEFLRLYPAANILVANKKDFETQNRRKFCARIATGDYDAVIIGHSQFERIPMSLERQERLLREQIEEIENGIREIKASGGEQLTVKQFEGTKKKLQERLKKLVSRERKDNVVTFEQLGVDRLFVDEAHSYKNGFVYTKMRNVAGLSTTEAQKSSDMYMKTRYMDEITGGKGTIFATGTPVSNSMTEMFVMQRYMQYDTLKEKGLLHFDAWASTFGETTTEFELAPEGTGYRARTRFSKFFNLPELMSLFKEFADIKTADELNLKTPTIIYETVVAQPTDIQKELVGELSERAKKVHNREVDPSIDNMLLITSDGRKLGLDQRVVNPTLPDDPDSKVNRCVGNIFRIWEDGKDEKLTQLLFCDLSTPKPRPKPDKVAKAGGSGINGVELSAIEDALPPDMLTAEAPFSIYHDIREKLIAMGIPEKEIAFIHEANTDAKKKELFSKMRSGDVRVMLGSTSKCGTGMCVQDRLIAMHDLDCPWRPGEDERAKW